MSLNHSFPLFSNNPSFSELTVILLSLLILTGCDPYTPEEHAKIDPIHQRFDAACEAYLAIRPRFEERRHNDCDEQSDARLKDRPTDAEIAQEITAYQACQDEYAAYSAKADELEEELYAAVRERDALGFVSWREGQWICHTGHHSRD